MNSLQVVPAPRVEVFRPGSLKATEALVFQLDDQEYGISLRCVQEIRSYQAPTRLAGACDYVLGIMDLRGDVVPLIDLRRRLGMPASAFDEFTVVIVITLGDRRVAVVADRVSDVVEMTPEQVRPMPVLRGSPDQRHFVAIASMEARTVVLLDIESLLGDLAIEPAVALAA
jgi:purine-binding chemotaxis protein CheW